MKHSLIVFFCNSIIYLLAANSLFAQSWDLVKDKEGIKVYIRSEPNSTLKSFRGEVTLNVPADKISKLIIDPDCSDWWEKNFIQSKLLDYKEGKSVLYYLVYGLPWPLNDRDFVSETSIIKDSVTGKQTLISRPLLNIVPVKPDLIRINEFSQKWILQPLDEQNVHVIFEGFIDPGGNLPAWLNNIVLPETPFKTLHSLKERSLSDSSVQSINQLD
jgi:hypothetical protein